MKIIFKQSGVSLLELMLALAVIALLLLSAMRYYTVTQLNASSDNTARVVRTIGAAAERWAIGNNNSFMGLNDISMLVNQDLLSTHFIKNPWGGNNNVNSLAPDTLEIRVEDIPQKACFNIANLLRMPIESLENTCKGKANKVTLVFCYPSGICPKQ